MCSQADDPTQHGDTLRAALHDFFESEYGQCHHSDRGHSIYRQCEDGGESIRASAITSICAALEECPECGLVGQHEPHYAREDTGD